MEQTEARFHDLPSDAVAQWSWVLRNIPTENWQGLTTVCHHCGYETDDAEHTMFRCTSWEEERAEVVRVIGEFDPESVIGKMLNAPKCWNAVSRYATSVMLQKEDAERIRREEPERGVTT